MRTAPWPTSPVTGKAVTLDEPDTPEDDPEESDQPGSPVAYRKAFQSRQPRS